MAAKFFGFEKFANLKRSIKEAGGLKAAYKKIYRYDVLKFGEHVGTDQYGNRYYKNSYYFYGRNRWVEFADKHGLDYDASQIPPEWYGWLHYKTDLTPEEDSSRPKFKWMAKHTENLSGTPDQYMPYSTTRPKIIPWDGKDGKDGKDAKDAKDGKKCSK